jgi:hypothetical protein
MARVHGSVDIGEARIVLWGESPDRCRHESATVSGQSEQRARVSAEYRGLLGRRNW